MEIFDLARADSLIRQKFNVPKNARLGWHFIREDKKLRYDDGRTVEVGQTLSTPKAGGRPSTCNYGMHASPTIEFAMKYAPNGNTHLCLVWVQGQIDEDEDKFCGTRRHCLAMIDHATFQPAREQYEAVEQPAREQYEAVKQTAWKQYEAVEQPAWKQLEFEVLKLMGVFESEAQHS